MNYVGFAFCKFVLFFLNLILTLLGVALSFFGVWMLIDYISLVNATAALINDPGFKGMAFIMPHYALGIVLTTIGASLLLASWIGEWASVAESRCLLGLYLVFVLLLLLGQLGIFITYFAANNKKLESWQKVIEGEFSEKYRKKQLLVDKPDAYSHAANIFMIVNQCCQGDTNNEACKKYDSFDFIANNLKKYADFQSNPEEYNTMACMDSLSKIETKYQNALIIAGCIILFIQLLSIATTSVLVYLIKRIDNHEYI